MYGFEKRQSEPVWMLVELMTNRGLSGRSWRVELAEDVLAICARDPVGDGAGQQDAADDGAKVDRLRRELPNGLDELLVEVGREAVGVEHEVVPVHPEGAGSDRAAGDARDPVELRQVAELVEAPERPDVKEHGAVAAA